MLDEVKTCIDAKINFFEEYFTAPDGLKAELDMFVQDTTVLGEHCGSAAEFESEFAATGLSERFNGLIPKCTPKARKMTKEEKQKSRETAKEILLENKEELAKDALADTASRLLHNVQDKRIQESHEQMLADGTHAEHTIRKNNIKTAGAVASFLGDIFKKGGNQK